MMNQFSRRDALIRLGAIGLSVIGGILLPFSESRADESLKIKTGDSREMVIAAYGRPSKEEVLPNYDPPVMSHISYSDKGIVFELARGRVAMIYLKHPFVGDVEGIKIGDPLSRAVKIKGKQNSIDRFPYLDDRGELNHRIIYRWDDGKKYFEARTPSAKNTKIDELRLADTTVYPLVIPKFK